LRIESKIKGVRGIGRKKKSQKAKIENNIALQARG
jgi:hypothetical protein